MIDHDRLFKELLRAFFVEFLDLFLPDVRNYLDPDSLVFLDKEVFTDITAGERYEADLVVKTQFRGEPSCFLIHVEHQAQAEVEFGRRMLLTNIQSAEQEKVMELITTWEEKGLQRGRQEEGLRILLRQLTRRIGPIGTENEARLRSLSIDDLETLSEALFDFSDMTDLIAWLQNHSG